MNQFEIQEKEQGNLAQDSNFEVIFISIFDPYK